MSAPDPVVELDLAQSSWCDGVVTLDELRALEISIRERLVAVRAELATAVETMHDTSHAKDQIAAEGGPNDGAYRKAADERLGNLRERLSLSLKAESDRERLRAQETALLVELEKNRDAFDRAGVRRVVLPALIDIPDAAPCTMRWQDMTGDGDERICTRCNRIVRNVAMLEAADAVKFPTANPNAPFYRRKDGTIISGNCKEGEQGQRFTRAMIAALGAVTLIVSGVLFLTRKPSKETPPPTAVDLWPGPAPSTSTLYPASAAMDESHSGRVRQSPIQDVRAVDIVDTSLDHGVQRNFEIQVSTSENFFTGSVKCNSTSKQIDIPAITVFAFLEEVNQRWNDPYLNEIPCTKKGISRQIKIDVTMSGHDHPSSVTVRNCSGQWYENEIPLNLDRTIGLDPFSTRLGTRYQAILDATACAPN